MWTGDGCLIRENNYHYTIELKVKDRMFAFVFSNNMAKVLNKKCQIPKLIKRENMWRVRYRSKAFYAWYNTKVLKDFKRYIEYNKNCVKYFLRGLYDSEGSNYRCKQIILSNDNLSLLRYIQHLLKKYFKIIATGPYINNKAGGKYLMRDKNLIIRRKDNYRLVISRKSSVKTFLEKIGFTSRGKQLGQPQRSSMLSRGEY